MIKADIFNDKIRNDIVELAKKQVGKLYVHGEHGDHDTFDCAGLVWFVYDKKLNINVYYLGFGKSTSTKIMTSKYGIITSFDENSFNKDINLIKKGDIVFFHRQSLNDNEPTADNKYPGHCGIYIGDNQFIHCSGTKKKVIISSFDNEYWMKKYVGFKDIIDYKILTK